MDELYTKIFVSLGSSGVLGWIMWLLFKKSMKDGDEDRKNLATAHSEIVNQLTTRVDAIERSHLKCEEDRNKLWERLLGHYDKSHLAGPQGPLP